MKLLKRIESWLDVEREFQNRFGNVVTQTFVIPGQTYSIAHGLSHTPRGWRIVDVDIAGASFGRTDWNSETITIYSNMGNVTASFEIF